ncbi:cleft lip and palate transmembrane protein 1-like protein isoform X1 [Arapaima gigas]
MMTPRNGTLYGHLFVHHTGETRWQNDRQVHRVVQFTTYMLPRPVEVSVNLVRNYSRRGILLVNRELTAPSYTGGPSSPSALRRKNSPLTEGLCLPTSTAT